MLGSIVGLFLGLPGIVIGPFAGALLGEFAVRRDWNQAGRAGLGTWIGLALGTADKVAIVFMMLGIFGTSIHDGVGARPRKGGRISPCPSS